MGIRHVFVFVLLLGIASVGTLLYTYSFISKKFPYETLMKARFLVKTTIPSPRMLGSGKDVCFDVFGYQMFDSLTGTYRAINGAQCIKSLLFWMFLLFTITVSMDLLAFILYIFGSKSYRCLLASSTMWHCAFFLYVFIFVIRDVGHPLTFRPCFGLVLWALVLVMKPIASILGCDGDSCSSSTNRKEEPEIEA